MLPGFRKVFQTRMQALYAQFKLDLLLCKSTSADPLKQYDILQLSRGYSFFLQVPLKKWPNELTKFDIGAESLHYLGNDSFTNDESSPCTLDLDA